MCLVVTTHSGQQQSKASAALLMTYCNGTRAEPWLWSVWWQLHAVSSTQSPPPSPLSGQVKRISVKWCCSASMFHIINNQFGHKFRGSGEGRGSDQLSQYKCCVMMSWSSPRSCCRPDWSSCWLPGGAPPLSPPQPPAYVSWPYCGAECSSSQGSGGQLKL